MKHFSFTVGFLALALVACSSTAPVDSDTDTSSSSSSSSVISSSSSSDASLPAGSFSAGDLGFSGDLYVRGYARSEKVNEPFCQEDCSTFTYIFFHITETSNPSVSAFLEQHQGNAFVRDNAIGLGCGEEGIISFTHNNAEDVSMQEKVLSKEVSMAILNSTSRNTVTLHLTKLPNAPGTEAPACYSHIDNVELY